MKVLMINTVCGIRSTGRICTDLAVELEKRGYEVKIAYGREDVPEQYQKYAVRIGNDLDVRIHGLQARLYDNAGFGSKFATKKFINWVKDYNPDIIHLHNIHGYYINVEILFEFLRNCGKKIIWTLHDCWTFTGHCVYFDYISCNRWKSGCDNCQQKREYPSSIIVDNSKKNYEKKKNIFTGIPNMTLVTPSKWLDELIKKSYMSEYPVEVIYNGVDTSIFKPTESDFKERYKLKDKKIVLGVAAIWDRRKGLDTFVELSKILPDEYKIVIVGLTIEQLKDLPKNIVGITRTNSVQELAAIYSSADVFVNPTLEDNYPTTNIEAIACGTPVITYATGGSVESATLYGKVVEQGNIKELADAIVAHGDIEKTVNAVEIDGLKTIEKYLELYLQGEN